MLVLVGALTASPAVPMERQARTTTMLWVLTVPTTPRAAIKLTAKNQRRTLVGSAPRLISRSSSQPAMTNSATTATAHGITAYTPPPSTLRPSDFSR